MREGDTAQPAAWRGRSTDNGDVSGRGALPGVLGKRPHCFELEEESKFTNQKSGWEFLAEGTMFAKAITPKGPGLIRGGREECGVDGPRSMLGSELGLGSQGWIENGPGSLIRTLDLSLGHRAPAKILQQRCA